MRSKKFTASSILFLFATLFALGAQAASVGQVLATKGQVNAVGPDRQTRVLAPQAAIQTGDTLRTGAGAAAQIRFVDGAILALREKTEYRVDDYRFNERDAKANASVATFIQGSFRTVTGLIGKLKPTAYKVHTPVAILGVRGTSYDALLSNGLYVAVWRGTVVIENQGGTILVGEGTPYKYAFVPNIDTLPQGLTQPPPLLENLTGTTTDVLLAPDGTLAPLLDPNLNLPGVPSSPSLPSTPSLPQTPSLPPAPIPIPTLPKLP